MFYGDDLWLVWISRDGLCESEKNAGGPPCARDVVAVVAWFFGGGLVLQPGDASAPLYEPGGDGGLADVGGTQLGMCLDFSERGRGEREGL